MKYQFGCTNKMFWTTEAEARAYHKRIKFKGISARNVKRFYKCRFADHWHATSMNKSEFKRRGFHIPKLQKRFNRSELRELAL